MIVNDLKKASERIAKASLFGGTGNIGTNNTPEEALKNLFIQIFSSDGGGISIEMLREWGIYIGGFLYFYHDIPKVDYRFFKHARQGGDESEGDDELGYMFPYIASQALQNKTFSAGKTSKGWEYFVDSCFLAHRKCQENFIWDLELAKKSPHLVPEYIAKTAFFRETEAEPHLYVSWQEMCTELRSYRHVLGRIADEPPSGFKTEDLLWCALEKKSDCLTEVERWLIDERIKQQPALWNCFFSSVNVDAASYPAERQDIDESTALLRKIHRKSRFPLLAYLYWNAFDQALPKTHMVLPIWVDYLEGAAKCVRISNDEITTGSTYLAGAAVVSVSPVKEQTTESRDINSKEVDSITAASLLARFVSLPQVAETYYGHIRTERKHRVKRQREAAVAAIAAQSLSHNIGSHALSDARLFDFSEVADVEGLRDFHQYLQGRLDYVAQLIARAPPQPEPMYLWHDVFREFFRQRLLLDRLVADRSVEGRNLSFKVMFPDSQEELTITWNDIKRSLGVGDKSDGGENKRKDSTLPSIEKDVLVAIPGGSVGRHALYSILENMMRNSVKYGQRRRGKKGLCIHFRLRTPSEDYSTGKKPKDYWILEIWDNFSGFAHNDEAANRFGELAKNFDSDVITNEGKTRTSGHGLVEIKEAMRFLHDHADHLDKYDEGSPYACEPYCHRTSPAHGEAKCGTKDCNYGKVHCCHANLANVFDEKYGGRKPNKDIPGDQGDGVLVYRIRLYRPRMLGVWSPGYNFDSAATENVTEGVFFRNGMSLAEPGPNNARALATLAPHLLVIRDPDNGEIENIAKELAEQQWRLPFRLFVVTKDDERFAAWRGKDEDGHWNGGVLTHWEGKAPLSPVPKFNDPFLPKNKVRVLISPYLHTKLSKPDAMDLSLVNEVYDHWLMAYKPLVQGQKWKFFVGFDRPEKTVKKLWEAACDQAISKLRSVSVDVFWQQKKQEGFIVGDLADAVDADNSSRLIYFGNHGVKPRPIKLKNAAFQQEFGSKEAPKTFNLLFSPPPDIQPFIFYIISIVEAALTKIAIFDERSISMYLEENEDNEVKHLSTPRLNRALEAGIVPLVSVPSGKDNVEAIARIDVLPAGNKFFGFNYLKGEAVTTLTNEVCDALILHEGLIEELASCGLGTRFVHGNDLAFLSKFTRIVRTSGKGRDARKLDRRLPFCEYSTISASVGPYTDSSKVSPERMRIEKVGLAKAVLNSVGYVE